MSITAYKTARRMKVSDFVNSNEPTKLMIYRSLSNLQQLEARWPSLKKIPPTGAEIHPKRYLVLRVSCPELLTDRNGTYKGHSACENHTNRTEIQTISYFVHQAKCPQLPTERNQAYSVCSASAERTRYEISGKST